MKSKLTHPITQEAVWSPLDNLSVLTSSPNCGSVHHHPTTPSSIFKWGLCGLKKKNKNHVSSIWDALRSEAEQPRPGSPKAGVKIVETLTFTRANRGQVKALEKDVFPSDPCVRARVYACMTTDAWVHGWVRLSGGICPHIAPGRVVVAASVSGWLMVSGSGSQHSGSLMNLLLCHTVWQEVH